MIITCTNCKTSFVTAETSIGPSGRKVKCSKCQNVWFASLPVYSTANLSISNFVDIPADSIKLPTITTNKRTWYIYSLLIIILISAIISISTILWSSKLLEMKIFDNKLLCHQYAICSTTDIKLKNITLEQIIKQGKKILVLSYNVVNTGAEVRYIPNIKVKLLDPAGNIIKSDILVNRDVIIKPFNQHLVETRFEELPDDIKKIKLDIGNKIELMLR